MKTMELYGKTFNYQGTTNVPAYSQYTDIFSAYAKPSMTKISIWNEYASYFRQNFDNVYVAVCSRNVYMFTIIAQFDYEGKTYVAMIYPTHDDIWELV